MDNAHQPKDHSKLDVATSAFVAGAVGGMLTNPIEYLAVNKQTNSSFEILKELRKKTILYDMWVKGSLLRAVYNGGSAVFFFLFLQEICLPLRVDMT